MKTGRNISLALGNREKGLPAAGEKIASLG
jgi:hypothetical protein